MQLTIHRYTNQRPRFYVDGRRVSQDRYAFLVVVARLRGHEQNSFVTRRRKSKSGIHHFVQYSSLN